MGNQPAGGRVLWLAEAPGLRAAAAPGRRPQLEVALPTQPHGAGWSAGQGPFPGLALLLDVRACGAVRAFQAHAAPRPLPSPCAASLPAHLPVRCQVQVEAGEGTELLAKHRVKLTSMPIGTKVGGHRSGLAPQACAVQPQAARGPCTSPVQPKAVSG